MENKGWLYKILNLEKGEGMLVTLLTFYSFFTGASLAYFVTSSTSLFLNSFDRDMLSIAFIVAGVIVWLVGQIFSQIQKKFDFSKSLISGLGFLLISIIIFIVLFVGSKQLVIIFLIYAWIRVFAYIHAVTFWGMAGRLFSLRQGKRIFGLISGGEVVASIISFFSVPFLLKVMSTEDLLIISGVNLLIGFLVLLWIIRKFSGVLSTLKKQTKLSDNKQIKKISFFENRYFKLFFLIAFIPIFAQFFVDYIFQAQAKMEYPGKEELTSFVGIFFGLSSIVEFALKTFISGRLMSRYGMKLGLLSFPVVMAISLIMSTFFGFIYGAFSLFFSFIALARLFTRAVRTSFSDPSTQLLYQPLPPDERIAFQNKVESGPKAYASIVAGIFLLVFAKIPGFNLVYFSLFLLFVTVIWTYSSNEIYKEYRHVLQSILSRKRSPDLNKTNHPLIDKILINVKSGDLKHAKALSRVSKMIIPFETDKILDENTGFHEIASQPEKIRFSSVIELSKSEKASERIFALRQFHKYSIYKVEKPLIRLLHDEDYEVRSEAIIASAKMRETELFQNLVTLFQNPDFKIIASEAMKHIGTPIIPDLDHNFQKTEYDIGLQLKTIELFEQIGGDKAIEFLRRNLNHHNKSVSDRIIEALAKLNYRANANESQSIVQKLEYEIKNYVFVVSAIYNLRGQINSVDLFNSLEREKKDKKDKIFAKLSVLYDPVAINLIAESIDNPDRNARGFAIEIADLTISDMHKPLIMPLLESDRDDELLQRYMLYYPTERLGIVEQLIDIINSEYWVIGLFAKATALRLLAAYNDNRSLPILMANIVHPRQIIWQLSAYLIYLKDTDIFEEEIFQNFPKVPGLKEFSANIGHYHNGKEKLIYDWLLKIKTLDLFSKIPEDELIDIASQLKYKCVEIGGSIQFSHKLRKYIIVIEGSLNEAATNKDFKTGSVICPFLNDQMEKCEYSALSQVAEIIEVDMNLINALLIKYNEMSVTLMKSILNNGYTEDLALKMPVTNGIINANQ